MKTAIQILSFSIVGLVLSTAGIGMTNWQFYAILVIMAINGPRLSSETGKRDEAKCHCVNPVHDCHEAGSRAAHPSRPDS